MHTWYRAVCDAHKEACHIIVTGNYHAKFMYQQEDSDLICAFLIKHHGCNLRLIHDGGTDIDYLYENKYLCVDNKIIGLNDDARKKYVLENNKMFDQESYDKCRKEAQLHS